MLKVSYDRGYDEPDRSMTDVSCSDGINGLITRYKWPTQGDIPVFPYIGGVDAIPGWNSPNVRNLNPTALPTGVLTKLQCGTCWELEYLGKSINILAVDHAEYGFNIGLRAMDILTGGQSIVLGRVNVNFSQVPVSACGL